MSVLVWLSVIMSVVALVGVRLLLRAWSISNDEIMEIIKRLRESVEIAQMLNQRIDELQKEVKKDDGRGGVYHETRKNV